MAGFLSGSSAMTVLTVEKPEAFSMDRLRSEAFKDEGPLGEARFGFVGMGDPFDAENFSLALCDGELSGFSFRVDEQKPSASAVKLEVEKRIIRTKETSGKKYVSRKTRRKLPKAFIVSSRPMLRFRPRLLTASGMKRKSGFTQAPQTKSCLKACKYHSIAPSECPWIFFARQMKSLSRRDSKIWQGDGDYSNSMRLPRWETPFLLAMRKKTGVQW